VSETSAENALHFTAFPAKRTPLLEMKMFLFLRQQQPHHVN
jgi:hypothetical protein